MSKELSRPLEHVCEVCGGFASQGVGVFADRGIPGRWFCFPHLPADLSKHLPAPVARPDADARRPMQPGEQGRLL